jgi:hypothetical protein
LTGSAGTALVSAAVVIRRPTRREEPTLNGQRITTLDDPALSAEIRASVTRIAENLPPDTSCVATGSLVEGLGNANSDIDLYVIHHGEDSRLSVSFGLRGSRYVDCEHLAEDAVAELAERVPGLTWGSLHTARLRDIDRFYRLSISIPVRVDPRAESLLPRFGKAAADAAFARWARMRAHEHLARAACLLASGAEAPADVLLREAALWHASYILAETGEGYPSLKWMAEKAGRQFGRDSTVFHELVDGWLRPSGSLAERLARQMAVDAPPDLLQVLELRSCALAAGVRFVPGKNGGHLVRGTRSVARCDGLVASVCSHMAAGLSWHEATDQVAARISVAPPLVRTAAWYHLVGLRDAGFIGTVQTETAGRHAN